MAEAGVVEHGAAAASGEQAIVIPFFDDPSLFHDDDTVRGFDGGQAMGDLRMLVALVKAKPLKFGMTSPVLCELGALTTSSGAPKMGTHGT